MDIVIGGMRNVLRNPLRLLLVVFLLGASLMLVAAMVSLNSSAQQQLANVHQEVGTATLSIMRPTIARAPDRVQRMQEHRAEGNKVAEVSFSSKLLPLSPTVQLRK